MAHEVLPRSFLGRRYVVTASPVLGFGELAQEARIGPAESLRYSPIMINN